MEYLILVFVFIYGLIFGSFYNVVIYRLPFDMSISEGRSKCTSCGYTLKAKDLIPVISFIMLKGKCRSCGNSISYRYPAIELLTGVLFSLAYLVFGLNLQMIFIMCFWSYLLIVTMIDIDHKLILDNISIVFFIIFLALDLFILKKAVVLNLIAGVVALLVYLLIYKVAFMYYKREAFGLGDVFFISVVSFCLGFKVLYLTIFFPFIVAVVCIGLIMLLGKKFDINKEVPFAPFISLSAFILSIFGEQMMKFIFLT